MGLEGSKGEWGAGGAGDPGRVLEALGRALAHVFLTWGVAEDAEQRSDLLVTCLKITGWMQEGQVCFECGYEARPNTWGK